jgi:Tfp pilus assembly protein PilO
MRIIIPLSFIVISVAIFFLGLNPIYKKMTVIRKEVKIYKEALDNSSELQAIRDSLIEKYKNIKKEDRDRLNQFLPTNIDNIELILEIERIANLNGMPIENIVSNAEDLKKKVITDEEGKSGSKLDSVNNLPYGVFPFEFTVRGRYESFLNFLKELESNLRLIDIRDLTISVSEKPSSTSTSSGTNSNTNTEGSFYNYSLKVETYWLK